MQKHIHVNSSFGGFQTSTKRVHSGRVNGKDVFTDFLVVSGTSHIIRNSTMNGIFYPAAAFDDLANRLMASNERVPAPLSHPSDDQGRFISAKDPLILSAHGIFSFDTNWRISGDKLISDTYIDVKRAAENPHASWLIERLNNRQPIDRSTGLELMISETSGVGPDGDEYHMKVEEIVNLDHSAILNPESEPGAKCGLDGVGMYVNASGEHTVENVDLFVNASNPNLNLPLAPKGYDWNAAEAVGRIRAYTGSEESPTSHYRKFFMYFSADNVDDFGSYKLPFADIIDGRPHAVIGALAAIDGALSGAREGVDIPEADKEKVTRNVEHYKAKMSSDEPSVIMTNSKFAQFMAWFSNKFGISFEKEYNQYVITNTFESEDPMKDKIISALNARGIKTEGLDDDALFAAYNEAMKPKAEDKKKEDDEEEDKPKEDKAANAKLFEAINALTAEVKEMKAASNASARAEIDALAAQVANANILPLDDAKKLSKEALNSLLAKSGVVVANGAGGFVAQSSFDPMPE